MTQWYQPLEKKSGENAGKFHMTVQTNSEAEKGVAHAIGYCAENCPGHDTPAEALAHWREYLADKAEFFSGNEAKASTLHRCEAAGCDQFTDGGANVPGGYMYNAHLCARHRTRDDFYAVITRERA